MGLLKRKSADQQLEQAQAKSRTKAAKAGVMTADAIVVGHWLNGKAWCSLVVRPDRVELHNHGEVGSLGRKGSGVTTFPADQITAVSSARFGLSATVRVVSGTATIEFDTNPIEAPALVDAVNSITD